MDLRCFVRVLSEDGDALGTGYLISRERVLTAAHVVGDAERVAIEYDDVEGESVIRAGATVHWRGDDSCDVALLLLAAPTAIDVQLPRLGDTPIDAVTSWVSRGWALPSLAEPRVRDSMMGLLGEASQFTADQKRFQLTVDVQLERVDLWCGVSGAPVFERGTSRILGVVAEAAKLAENLLYASPLSVAFRRAGFLEKLGGEIVRERRERLIADVKTILARSQELVAAFASCHEDWRRGAGVPTLADAILATDVVQALTRLNTIHLELSRKGRQAAREVEGIVALIAPVLVQGRVLHALPNEPGGVWLRLPVTTITVAELAIAGFDGRPSALKTQETEYPEGQARLPLPTSEEGFDIDGKATLQAYATHLEKSRLTSEDREHLKRLRGREGGEETARDKVFELVDSRLEFEAEQGDQPLRHYLLYPAEFAEKNPTFLRDLRKAMKSIHLVEMVGDDLVGERRICYPLCSILTRAARATEAYSGGPRS